MPPAARRPSPAAATGSQPAVPPFQHRLPCHPTLQRGVPEGTPVVPVRDLPSRPRRNRKSETVRRAFSETFLHPGELPAAGTRCSAAEPCLQSDSNAPNLGARAHSTVYSVHLGPSHSPLPPPPCSQLHPARVCARWRAGHPHHLHARRGAPGLAPRPAGRGGRGAERGGEPGAPPACGPGCGGTSRRLRVLITGCLPAVAPPRFTVFAGRGT